MLSCIFSCILLFKSDLERCNSVHPHLLFIRFLFHFIMIMYIINSHKLMLRYPFKNAKWKGIQHFLNALRAFIFKQIMFMFTRTLWWIYIRYKVSFQWKSNVIQLLWLYNKKSWWSYDCIAFSAHIVPFLSDDDLWKRRPLCVQFNEKKWICRELSCGFILKRTRYTDKTFLNSIHHGITIILSVSFEGVLVCATKKLFCVVNWFCYMELTLIRLSVHKAKNTG